MLKRLRIYTMVLVRVLQPQTNYVIQHSESHQVSLSPWPFKTLSLSLFLYSGDLHVQRSSGL